MKTAVFMVFFLLAGANSSLAGYMAKVISDVNLRTAKGTESRPVSIVKSGKPLTVIEESDTWVKVVTPDGKQGWINRKFIVKTGDMPEDASIKVIKKDQQPEGVENSGFQAGMEEPPNPEYEIQNLRAQLDDVTHQLETLKKETADCLSIKPEYEKALEEIESLNKIIDDMDKKIVSKGIMWFLAGAGVLLFGWFIGITSRPKSRY